MEKAVYKTRIRFEICIYLDTSMKGKNNSKKPYHYKLWDSAVPTILVSAGEPLTVSICRNGIILYLWFKKWRVVTIWLNVYGMCVI